jgi:hypothetical protein
MANNRGNINTIDQTQIAQLSGGTAATKFITTNNSTRTAGHLLMSDASGNAVDAGVDVSGVGGGGTGTTHAEILTDGSGNFIFAGGDLVYVVGVPN